MLNENQRIPADMILLKTFNNDEDDNHAFIRTARICTGVTTYSITLTVRFITRWI